MVSMNFESLMRLNFKIRIGAKSDLSRVYGLTMWLKLRRIKKQKKQKLVGVEIER